MSQSRIDDFWDCITKCNLMDMGFRGPKFTWTNLCRDGNLIREKLDRAWCNSDWQQLYPNFLVTHRPRTHSDHRPILIDLCPSSILGPRPFRFKSCWLSQPDFLSVASQTWLQPPTDLVDNLNDIASFLNGWNKNAYRNGFHRKRRVLARLEGIQCSLSRNHSDFLLNLEQELIKEYNSILSQEEE